MTFRFVLEGRLSWFYFCILTSDFLLFISDFCNLFLMPRKRIQLRCPICRKPAESSGPDFPFCSERCRLLDLGKWASGGYVIPSPVTDEEEIPNIPEASPNDLKDRE